MERDKERLDALRAALGRAGLDALVCALPRNVLLLSGYWPVIGASVAIVTRDGRSALLIPEGERSLAEHGWAEEVRAFHPGSVKELHTSADAVGAPLAELARAIGLFGGRVGHEAGETYEPSSYSSLHLYGDTLPALLTRNIPNISLASADDLLAELRATLTARERGRLALACNTAGIAFEAGRGRLRAGLTEVEAAELFRPPLSTRLTGRDGVQRADGYVWCMSGPNSAKAHAAFARSTDRSLQQGDFVLVHCNSYADGFWTDVTRTYCLGQPSERQRRLYEAVLAAREAALAAIRPGVRGSEVDRAARGVLEEHGLGKEFKHSTGHGVGFAAIDHNARPRLHPVSDDVLRPGMTFNVEPAVYFDGYGGLRHCDVVAVTATGAEVLTPFHSTLAELILS